MSQVAKPQTFHLFPQLPTEIQIPILGFAAEVRDTDSIEWLREDSLHDAATVPRSKWKPNRDSSNDKLGPRPDYFSALINQSIFNGYRTRNALLWTCRVSRLLALQAWKVDLEAIVLGDDKYSYLRIDGSWNIYDDIMLLEWVVGTVHELIGKVRKRPS